MDHGQECCRHDKCDDSHDDEHVLCPLGLHPGSQGKKDSHAQDITDEGNTHKCLANKLRLLSAGFTKLDFSKTGLTSG